LCLLAWEDRRYLVRFSLVMATVGRTGEPGAFLASLYPQGVPLADLEVTVADQNPDDRLEAVLEPHRGRLRIFHLRLGRMGASRARNAGLRRARGEFVAFPDDDCRYPPGLLRAVARAFEAHPEASGITGRLVDEAGRDSILPFDPDPGLVTKGNVWTRGIEATLFFRGSALSGLWFDETLGRGAGTPWGSGEGTDLVLRLIERGHRVVYEPSLTVLHPQRVPPYGPKADWRAYDYGRGMGRVLKLHRYGALAKTRYVAEPVVRAARALVFLRPSEARYHLNAAWGRLEGML